ncbi:MAG: FAD-linked oxidase C-terminal domain-containing protein [bacterium]
MGHKALQELARDLTTAEALITDLAGYEKYCHDATEETGSPLALVLAETEGDVVATMRFAHRHHIPVVPRGTGTGLSGGAVPSEGCLLLSLERMRTLEIDAQHRLAICGPGVITKELMDAAAKHDLTYPPDPASYEECSLGGNVAENAGGLRCKRFGVTRDYVLGLRAVIIDGGVLTTGCCNKEEALAMGDLLIGSEGTLAVITQMTLRLIPIPDVGHTVLVAFDRPQDAARAIAGITAAGIIPNVMEYLDGDAAACSNKYEKLDGLDRAAAIVLIETTGDPDGGQLRSISDICRTHHCSYLRSAADSKAAAELWRVRRNLSKAIRDVAKFRYNEDVAVPVSQFSTLIAYVSELNGGGPIRINAFGHAGDGNLHVSFLAMTGSDEELAVIGDGVDKLYRRTIALRGTLSGEHGIGLHKGRYLPWEFDQATLGFMKSIKEVFDPRCELNPGKIFPE